MGAAFSLEFSTSDHLFTADSVEAFNERVSIDFPNADFKAIELLSCTRSSRTFLAYDRRKMLRIVRAQPRAAMLCAPLGAVKGASNTLLQRAGVEDPGALKVSVATLLLGTDQNESNFFDIVEHTGIKILNRAALLLGHPLLSPNTCPFDDIYMSSTTMLMTKEYIGGHSLHKILNDPPFHRSLSNSTKNWWLFQMLVALQQLHACGLSCDYLTQRSWHLSRGFSKLSLTNIGPVALHMQRVPRQQAAIAFDIFFSEADSIIPQEQLDALERAPPLFGIAELNTTDHEALPRDSDCTFAPERFSSSVEPEEVFRSPAADVYSLGCIVTALYLPFPTVSIFDLEDQLDIAFKTHESFAEDDLDEHIEFDSALPHRVCALLQELPEPIKQLVASGMLRKLPEERLSPLAIINHCVTANLFPEEFMSFYWPLLVLTDLSSCATSRLRRIVLSRSISRYVLGALDELTQKSLSTSAREWLPNEGVLTVDEQSAPSAEAQAAVRIRVTSQLLTKYGDCVVPSMAFWKATQALWTTCADVIAIQNTDADYDMNSELPLKFAETMCPKIWDRMNMRMSSSNAGFFELTQDSAITASLRECKDDSNSELLVEHLDIAALLLVDSFEGLSSPCDSSIEEAASCLIRLLPRVSPALLAGYVLPWSVAAILAEQTENESQQHENHRVWLLSVFACSFCSLGFRKPDSGLLKQMIALLDKLRDAMFPTPDTCSIYISVASINSNIQTPSSPVTISTEQHSSSRMSPDAPCSPKAGGTLKKSRICESLINDQKAHTTFIAFLPQFVEIMLMSTINEDVSTGTCGLEATTFLAIIAQALAETEMYVSQSALIDQIGSLTRELPLACNKQIIFPLLMGWSTYLQGRYLEGEQQALQILLETSMCTALIRLECTILEREESLSHSFWKTLKLFLLPTLREFCVRNLPAAARTARDLVNLIVLTGSENRCDSSKLDAPQLDFVSAALILIQKLQICWNAPLVPGWNNWLAVELPMLFSQPQLAYVLADAASCDYSATNKCGATKLEGSMQTAGSAHGLAVCLKKNKLEKDDSEAAELVNNQLGTNRAALRILLGETEESVVQASDEKKKCFRLPRSMAEENFTKKTLELWQPLGRLYSSLKPLAQFDSIFRTKLFSLANDHYLCAVSLFPIFSVSMWDVGALKNVGSCPTMYRWDNASTTTLTFCGGVGQGTNCCLFLGDPKGTLWLIDMRPKTSRIAKEEYLPEGCEVLLEIPPPSVHDVYSGERLELGKSGMAIVSAFLVERRESVIIVRRCGLFELREMAQGAKDRCLFIPTGLGLPLDSDYSVDQNWIISLTDQNVLVMISIMDLTVISVIDMGRPLWDSFIAGQEFFPQAVNVRCVSRSNFPVERKRAAAAIVQFEDESIFIIDMYEGKTLAAFLSNGSTDNAKEHVPAKFTVVADWRSDYYARNKIGAAQHTEPSTLFVPSDRGHYQTCVIAAHGLGHVRVWTLSDPLVCFEDGVEQQKETHLISFSELRAAGSTVLAHNHTGNPPRNLPTASVKPPIVKSWMGACIPLNFESRPDYCICHTWINPKCEAAACSTATGVVVLHPNISTSLLHSAIPMVAVALDSGAIDLYF